MQCLTCLGGLKIDSWTGKISGFDRCVPKTRFLIMNFLFCCQFLHIQYSFPMETFKSSSQLELRYRFLTECIMPITCNLRSMHVIWHSQFIQSSLNPMLMLSIHYNYVDSNLQETEVSIFIPALNWRSPHGHWESHEDFSFREYYEEWSEPTVGLIDVH